MNYTIQNAHSGQKEGVLYSTPALRKYIPLSQMPISDKDRQALASLDNDYLPNYWEAENLIPSLDTQEAKDYVLRWVNTQYHLEEARGGMI